MEFSSYAGPLGAYAEGWAFAGLQFLRYFILRSLLRRQKWLWYGLCKIETEEALAKSLDLCDKVFHHSCALLLACLAAQGSLECWFGNYFNFAVSCPENSYWISMSYKYQLSYYVSSLVLLTYKPKQRDFVLMAIHHIIAMSLVFYSYENKFCSAGIAMMLIHDLSDVFLYGVKLLKYTGSKRLEALAFVGLIVTFFGGRLLLFPYQLVMHELHWGASWAGEPALHVLLWMLLIPQVYWGFLIVRVMLRLLKEGKIEDPREEGKEYSKVNASLTHNTGTLGVPDGISSGHAHAD